MKMMMMMKIGFTVETLEKIKRFQPKLTENLLKTTKIREKLAACGNSYLRNELHLETGTNGFSLITFNGVGVQIWCLQSFCSKFNDRSDRLFKFGICFIFHG